MFPFRRKTISLISWPLKISLLINAAFCIWALSSIFKALRLSEKNEPERISSENGWKVRKMCENQLQVLFVVHTAADHTKERDILRSRLGTHITSQLLNSTLLFLVGEVDNQLANFTLHCEAQFYGDMVVLPFIDTYKNLSLKFLHGFRWAVEHCGATTTFFAKLDDDVLVNPFRLNSWLQNHSNLTTELWCNVIVNASVDRNRKSKWYVTPQEYAPSRYPNYCLGMAYIMPPPVVSALYQASQRLPQYWIDDVFATGILAEAAGVRRVDMSKYYERWPSPSPQKLNRDVIFTHLGEIRNFKIRLELWSHVLSDIHFTN